VADAYRLLAEFEAARANHERRLAMVLNGLARCGWTLGEPAGD
jgi:hypothetical protein